MVGEWDRKKQPAHHFHQRHAFVGSSLGLSSISIRARVLLLVYQLSAVLGKNLNRFKTQRTQRNQNESNFLRQLQHFRSSFRRHCFSCRLLLCESKTNVKKIHKWSLRLLNKKTWKNTTNWREQIVSTLSPFRMRFSTLEGPVVRVWQAARVRNAPASTARLA